MGDLNRFQSSAETQIVNENGHSLIVNADGSINTSGALSVPPGSTVINQTAFGAVATTSGTDLNYTITNGKTLTIQRLKAAAEGETGGTATELFYDPTGTGTPLTTIAMLIIDGASAQQDLNDTFVGNGTKRIILRRRGYTASGREVFARWEGYEL